MPSSLSKPIAGWEGALLLRGSRDFYVSLQSKCGAQFLCFLHPYCAEFASVDRLEKMNGCCEASPVDAEGCR